MNDHEKEKRFAETAKRFLDGQIQDLDDRTLTRLRAGRYRALCQTKRSVFWLWPTTGIAVACAGILAFYLFLKDPVKKEVIADLEDIELLASSEAIEFYDNLEFYGWLAENEGSG